jgi:hypothetical protein
LKQALALSPDSNMTKILTDVNARRLTLAFTHTRPDGSTRERTQAKHAIKNGKTFGFIALVVLAALQQEAQRDACTARNNRSVLWQEIIP